MFWRLVYRIESVSNFDVVVALPSTLNFEVPVFLTQASSALNVRNNEEVFVSVSGFGFPPSTNYVLTLVKANDPNTAIGHSPNERWNELENGTDWKTSSEWKERSHFPFSSTPNTLEHPKPIPRKIRKMTEKEGVEVGDLENALAAIVKGTGLFDSAAETSSVVEDEESQWEEKEEQEEDGTKAEWEDIQKALMTESGRGSESGGARAGQRGGHVLSLFSYFPLSASSSAPSVTASLTDQTELVSLPAPADFQAATILTLQNEDPSVSSIAVLLCENLSI
ncbi:hypothetical protein BLNAU_23761 [Blattamonas nauphoetae]|uniref:Uncharacterized protein n=1 Tax=Blattamonas nauphoetae TaxID=2049346 RepID=A0ABQ9WPA8_9EUKA|nr:hypothetical protein BLNAU_23761 [Blattamonas nauphoetae]